jgi:hypothetical protein
MESRVTEIEIVKQKVSDHDSVRWSIEMDQKRPQAKRMISIEMIKDKKYGEKVRQMYDEERKKGTYERFKERCLEEACNMKKKKQRKTKKDRLKMNKKIKILRSG